jgi:cytochrome c oxidase subunit 2
VSRKLWAVLFGGVILAEFLIFPVAWMSGWWLPKSISSYSARVDGLFFMILAVTAIAFVLTEAVLVWNMFRSAERNPDEKAPYTHGNHKLELIWTVVPGVLLLLLAIVQINVWAEIKYPASMKPEKDTLQIEVTARQWEWRIRYPGSKTLEDWENGTDKSFERFRTIGYEDKGQINDVHLVNEIHVVQGEKTLVWLKTRDVIHSFFLPNVRVKQDALPGKTIPLWFTVERRDKSGNVVSGSQEGFNYNCKKNDKGEWQDGYDAVAEKFDVHEQHWDLACAEFCGTRHSLMRGKLFVHKDREDFTNWLKSVEEKYRSGEEK